LNIADVILLNQFARPTTGRGEIRENIVTITET